MTTSLSTLDDIIANGNRGGTLGAHRTVDNNRITCADGFSLSVIAGTGTYCTPRPDWFHGGSDPVIDPIGMYEVGGDYAGPYTHVEVGYPSERPEPWEPIDGDLFWSQYAENPDDPTETVYGYVPAALVRHLVRSHGGES